jgi:hypothetical protein
MRRANTARTKKTFRGGLPSYLVFISHSSYDAWIAGQIGKEVKALGADYWLDQKDLLGGDPVLEKVLEGNRACNEAIVLISPMSANSQGVAFEIGAVSVLGKRVTPILNNVSPEAMARMKGVKAIDLNALRFLEAIKSETQST